MFVISFILAIFLYKVISQPATGPFSAELQHIWDSIVGKIIIVGILIVIAILGSCAGNLIGGILSVLFLGHKEIKKNKKDKNKK